MPENFEVEIITPEKTILKMDTQEVTIPSYEGEMGILKNHTPIITFLRPGMLSIKNQGIKKFYIEEGTVEFANNHLLILTTKIEPVTQRCSSILTTKIEDLAELKNSTIEKFIENAEERIKKNKISDKEKYLLSYKLESLKNLKK